MKFRYMHLLFFLLVTSFFACSASTEDKDVRKKKASDPEQLEKDEKEGGDKDKEKVDADPDVVQAKSPGDVGDEIKCDDCMEEVKEVVEVEGVEKTTEILLDIKGKQEFQLSGNDPITEDFLGQAFILQNLSSMTLIGPSLSMDLTEEGEELLAQKPEAQMLIDNSSNFSKIFPSYALSTNYWIHDTEAKELNFGYLENEGFEPELKESSFVVNNQLDFIVFANEDILIGLINNVIFFYKLTDAQISLTKVALLSEGEKVLEGKRVLYDPSSKTVGIFSTDSGLLTLVSLNEPTYFSKKVLVLDSQSKDPLNLSELKTLLSFSVRWAGQLPQATGKWVFADTVSLDVWSLEESVITPEAYFVENVQPAIEASCLGCHTDTAIQSGFLSANLIAENQSLLWAFENASDLVKKVSNQIAHGGGDQSGNLPSSRLQTWIDLRQSSELGAMP